MLVQRVPIARLRAGSRLLGPAFVAAVAYVDPGNVATNTAAGASYRYLLLWVLVVATLMAGLVQYLSAKVGWLTGRSLPALVGERNRPGLRRAFWVQAEIVAVATDLAEIVGGSIALNLLFGLPVLVGALVATAVSTALLLLQSRRRQKVFERVVTGLLGVVAVGFLAGLVVAPPDAGQAVAGLLPRLAGADSALLAVGMLGATVMPHAVYLHSALVTDRHGRARGDDARAVLRGVRVDVVLAMVLAGAVNIGMLLVAATTLVGLPVDGLPDAVAGIGDRLGSGVAVLFSLGLLASGLAATSVGGYAGAVITEGLLHRHIPLLVRRLMTAGPALVLLGFGLDPTGLLIGSQVVLSFGIPFALVPLVRIAADADLMRLAPTSRRVVALTWLVVGVVVALNATLVVLTLRG